MTDAAVAAFLGSIRQLLVANPQAAATPQAALSLAESSARMLTLYPGVRRQDFLTLSEIITRATPPALRGEAADTIRQAVLDLASGAEVEGQNSSDSEPASQAKATADSKAAANQPAIGAAAAPTSEAKSETAETGYSGKRGLALGSFRLIPSVDLTGYYDDNVFATRNDRVDDYIAVISPTIQLNSDWQRHELDLAFGADIYRHARQTGENANNYNASADWRYDFSRTSNIFGGGSVIQSHEDRESPDDVNGTVPTKYVASRIYGGASARTGKLAARLGGSAEWLSFSDVPSSSGIINNKDRDRQSYTGGLRLGYELTPRAELFVQPAADIRRYNAQTDDYGYDRDSDGYRALVGLRFNKPGLLQGDIYTGYMEQNYVDPLPDVKAIAFGGRVTVTGKAGATLSFYLDRTIEETSLPAASSYLYSVIGFSLDQQIGSRMIATLSSSYGVDEFEGITRTDKLVDAGAGLKYFFHPNYFIGTEYAYRHLHSDIEIESYTDNRVFLRIGAELSPHVAPYPKVVRRAGATREKDDPFSGLFAGVRIALDVPQSKVTGPRGPMGNTTTVTADFGHTGPGWGLVMGYGSMLGRWYAGVDINLDIGNSDWQFTRIPEELERSITVSKAFTYGAAIRVGYRVVPSILAFGKIGVAETEFTTLYSTPDMLIDRDDSKTGVQFGGGVEMPLLNSLFARVSYDHISYGSYSVDYGTGVDFFRNYEDSFALTLGYRF